MPDVEGVTLSKTLILGEIVRESNGMPNIKKLHDAKKLPIFLSIIALIEQLKFEKFRLN